MTSTPKLYRSVIDDVINSVRESFLDDGVDEQILHELKQTWEKKLTESKAVDNNAREPEPQTVTTKSRANNSVGGSHSSRNSQHNSRDISLQQISQQQQMMPHSHSTHMSMQSINTVHPNHNQLNHITGNVHTNLQQSVHLAQNIVLGPSGVNYTTNEPVDANRNASQSVPQKLVLVQGIGGQTTQMGPIVVSTGGTINLSPEILNQIALQHSQGNVMTAQPQQTVVHHTNNVGLTPNTIQFATSAPRAPQTVVNRPPQQNRVVQLDGAHDTSDEDDDDDDYRDHDDDHDDNDDDVKDEDDEVQGEDEEPLNSEDDVSDEDPTELFDTDNVVVCQYDKITRSRNKWKFHLKDGIMNLQGKDFVFQKAVGDAEW